VQSVGSSPPSGLNVDPHSPQSHAPRSPAWVLPLDATANLSLPGYTERLACRCPDHHEVIWEAVRLATRKAGIDKRVLTD